MSQPPVFSSIPPAPAPGPAYRVRFNAISDAWKSYQKDMAQWILCVVVAGLILTPIIIIFYFLLFASVLGSGGLQGGDLHPNIGLDILAYICMVPLQIVGWILGGGLTHRGLRQIRGETVAWKEMFNLQGQGREVATLGLYVGLVAFAISVLSIVLVSLLSAIPILAILLELVLFVLEIALGVIVIMLYLAPLVIIDQKVNAVEGIKITIQTFLKHFFPLLGVTLCGWILAEIGSIACGIGIIVTFPSICLLYPTIYNDFFRSEVEKDPNNPANWYPRQS